MILVKNMICITGITGFVLVCCFSRLGEYLFLHRAFSYHRKRNLWEVYRFMGIETVCISGILCLLNKIFEIACLLEPIGVSGALVVVFMTLLASFLCHAFTPVLHGIEVVAVYLVGLLFVTFLIVALWNGVYTNLYRTPIAVILLAINLFAWSIHRKLWKKADFL